MPTLKEILGGGLEADLGESKVRELFKDENGGYYATSCYLLWLEPVLDENGNQIIHEHKNFFGTILRTEPVFNIHYEFFTENLKKNFDSLYDDLVKANEKFLLANSNTIKANEIIESQNNEITQMRTAYNELRAKYNQIINNQ